MKKLRFVALLSLTLLVFIVPWFQAKGNQYAIISGNSHANVIEIIDGDSLKVRISSGEIALVRMVGIEAHAYDAAVGYLTRELMGKTVYLTFDSSLPRDIDLRWNYMYVNCDGVLINSELLRKG